MANTKKAPAVELQPEEIASAIAKELKPHLVAKRLADAEIKPLKERLIQHISDHKELFLPDDAKSCTVDGCIVTITTEAAYEYGDGFDLVKFYKAYPNAVKFEFKTAEMKNIDLKKHDLKALRKPKNTVELVKKNEPFATVSTNHG